MRKPARNDLPPIGLDRDDRPLSAQIHREIARAILSGALKPGARLPSTRMLSQELGVSRNTVNAAYEQLVAEGYTEGAVGVGTRVAPMLPPERLGRGTTKRTAKESNLQLSRRGSEIAKVTLASDQVEVRAIAIGNPALELFPWKLWKKLISQQIDVTSHSEFGYGSSLGHSALRAQIAIHLERTRGINVSSDRIIVVAGTQQALDLMARVLLDPGDRVLFEDPGYPGARCAFLAAGAQLTLVPVDREGMDINSIHASRRRARAAYVTPAHQFPLGSTMSLSRRLALLKWAEEHDAFILEDDYDGEFRHSGKPISAIASLDDSGRVIYIGTFSKILFPSLRLAFIVAPEHLVRPMTSVRGFVDRHSPGLEQITLAAFMEQGHFSRHIRNMRSIYTERRFAMLSSLAHGSDLFDIYAPETGAQVVINLRGISDKHAAKVIGHQEVAIAPISSYYDQPSRGNALLLGFSNASIAGIRRSARNLIRALRTIRKKS